MAITNTKNSKKGFTLVELVVVIAILAILAAIAIPVVNSIINTASRNGALSNAQTIELAVKECQADIAAKNDEVYDGSTTYKFVDEAGATKTGTLPKASTSHGDIDIQEVAGAKAISAAFGQVTYNGEDYQPYWDKDNAKCVFLTGGSTGKDLDTGKNYVGGTVVQLADGGTIKASVTIDSLSQPAAATPVTPAT